MSVSPGGKKQDSVYQYKAKDYIKDHENMSILRYVTDKEEKAHTHDFIELEYIWSGSGIQVINGVSYQVGRGDLLFFNFGEIHAYYTAGEMGIINYSINIEFFNQELVNSENAMDILALTSFNEFDGCIDSILPKIRLTGKDLMEVEAIIDFMEQEFREKSLGYLSALKGYMNVLFTKIFRTVKMSDANHVYQDIHQFIPGILEHIEENYYRKITLQELARHCSYNPSYFSRIFKDCTGKTISQYITETRMNKAVGILLETNLSIEDIGYSIGYKDKKQFYSVFKEYTGSTPNQFRLKNKK